MPNHVTNIITAPKYVIDRIIEDGQVEFALLIPQPENIEEGGCTGSHSPGVICWYDWRLENWGTKWGGYDTDRVSDTEVRFDTAWSHPVPFIEALAREFPTESIEVRYADEDLGYNFGHYTAKGPDSLEDHETPEAGTDQATLWAYRLKYNGEATMDTLVDEGYFGDLDTESLLP